MSVAGYAQSRVGRNSSPTETKQSEIPISSSKQQVNIYMFSSGKRLEILSFDIDYFLLEDLLADADIGKQVP